MRKKLVAIGAGMTLLLGGCTTSNEQSGPATTEAPTSAEAPSELTEGAQVENIFGDRLAVSSSPYETTHTLVGYWAAGQLALGSASPMYLNPQMIQKYLSRSPEEIKASRATQARG